MPKQFIFHKIGTPETIENYFIANCYGSIKTTDHTKKLPIKGDHGFVTGRTNITREVTGDIIAPNNRTINAAEHYELWDKGTGYKVNIKSQEDNKIKVDFLPADGYQSKVKPTIDSSGKITLQHGK